MKQASPRNTFHRTELIRTLSGLAVVDVAESVQPIAEQLGQWVGVTDALNLYSALNPAPAKTGSVGTEEGDLLELEQELARVRQMLGQTLRDGDLHKLAIQARIPLPRATPKDGDTDGEAAQNYTADFTPYRRYCLNQQRTMAIAIEALRAKARTLAAGSPALQRLASLDAGLEQIFSSKEGELLAGALRLLEKRFEHLRDTHHATCATQATMDTTDDPNQWMQPGGWLATFCNELRATLLAELDLRLQPVTGLIASCRTETEPS